MTETVHEYLQAAREDLGIDGGMMGGTLRLPSEH